ncbi:hypothetical protein JQR88_23585 (plasmid) [Pseudomonas luteola]|uniref:hypothetical protein n=1 Tax=Pseudomonas luteola TaxID=47886 RepID=UPI003DA15205
MRYLPFVLSVLAFPAVADVQLTNLADSVRGKEYRFPVFSGAPHVENINIYLQDKYLRHFPGNYQTSPFEKIMPSDEQAADTTALDYSVEYLTPSVLSLRINTTYSGAWSVDSKTYEQFDLTSGQPIIITDMFTPEGFKKLRDETIKDRLQQASKASANIEAVVDNAYIADEYRPRVLMMFKEQYEGCQKEIPTTFSADQTLRFYGDGIEVPMGRCTRGEIGEIDPVKLISTHFSLKKIAPWLNAYGQCLLVNKSQKCERASDTLQVGVYHGRIGEKLITMVIGDNDYVRMASGSGKEVMETEFYFQKPTDENPKAIFKGIMNPAQFDLTYANGSFKGIYHMKDNEQDSLPIVVNK